jgi:DNA repair exonuclease SbcCD ATPase subunit
MIENNMTSTDLTISSPPTTLVNFDLTVEQITAMGASYLALQSTDTASRQECGKARKVLVSTRTGIVKRGKELKQPLKDDMERIDEAAKLLIAALDPIETHLDTTIDAYDNAKKLEKEAKEAALRAENEARIAAALAEAKENARIAQEAMAAREAAYVAEVARQKEELEREKAELARHRAAIEAERVKVEAAAKAERERVEAAARADREAAMAETARILAEEKRRRAAEDAANKVEQDRLDDERESLEKERKRLDAIRIAQEQAEADRVAAAQAEEDRIAREEAERVADAKRKSDLEAARPDAEKLVEYAARLMAVAVPEVTTDEGYAELYGIGSTLAAVQSDMQLFLNTTNGISPIAGGDEF